MKNFLKLRSVLYYAVTLFLFVGPLGTLQSQDVIWSESFNDSDGTTVEIAESSWVTINDNIDTDESLWEVQSDKFYGSNLLGVGILKTESIDISEYENVSVSIEIDGDGPMETDVDYLNVYYRLDNGSQVLMTNGSHVGAFTATVATASSLNGKWLEIIVEAYNTYPDEYYIIDDIVVEGNSIVVEEANIWDETFNDFSDGTTVDTGATAWTIDNSNTNLSSGRFDVHYHRFEARNVVEPSLWFSEVIDISGFEDVAVSLDAYGFGYLEHNSDYMNIYYKLDGGAEILLENGMVTGPDTDGWTVDPVEAYINGLNGSTLQLIVVMRNGTENERFSIDNIRVSGIPSTGGGVEVTLSVSNVITCIQPSAIITTTVNETGLSYSWSGPNFVSDLQNPVVTEGGTYTVEVTNSGSEIVATESIVVEENTIEPSLTLSASGSLSCSNANVILSADVGGANVIYEWSGPGIDGTSTSPEVTVSEPGQYSVIVTSQDNGCVATSFIEVNGDTGDLSVEITGEDLLTCSATELLLQSSTDAISPTYFWTGPNAFTSSSSNVSVSEPGIYTLVVVDGSNGCSNAASPAVFPVSQDVNQPDITATGGIIDSSNPEVILTAFSQVSEVVYEWTGPNSFVSAEQNPTVDTPGIYEVTVTVIATGCTNSTQVEVTEA